MRAAASARPRPPPRPEPPRSGGGSTRERRRALGGRIAAGELARQPFQRRHHLERLRQAAALERRHLRAAVGQQRDQPFGGEQLERFSQRRARDPEPFAEQPLVQPGAGCELSLDDQVAQPVYGLLVKRSAAYRTDCLHE